jgi:hypothetical protein
MAWDKTPSMKDAVRAFFVTEDGKVNLEASVERFRSSALKHIAGQEAQDGLIVQCMTSLFDQYKGANLNLDYIKSQTVERMGKAVPELKEPSLFSILSARVETLLHDNCNQPAVEAKGDKPAVEAITGRTYDMRKGKGGGFYRVSDQAVKA